MEIASKLKFTALKESTSWFENLENFSLDFSSFEIARSVLILLIANHLCYFFVYMYSYLFGMCLLRNEYFRSLLYSEVILYIAKYAFKYFNRLALFVVSFESENIKVYPL